MITGFVVRRVRRVLAELERVARADLADVLASLRAALEARDAETFAAHVKFSATVLWDAARSPVGLDNAAWLLRRAAESCPRAYEPPRVLPRRADHRRAVLAGLAPRPHEVLH